MMPDINENMPLVSVIMPAYNAECYIEEAIRSVMCQTVQNWELYVIDDSSTDDTCAIVKRLCKEDTRIILVMNENNIGVARTRNKGFELCRGAYVALLDCDDSWHPEKLEKQLKRMQETDADISYCSYAVIRNADKSHMSDYIVPEQIAFEDMLKENLIGCSTVLITRTIAKQYKFCKEYYHEDYALWLEILRDGYKAVGCSDVLVNWRYIATSRSYNKLKSAKNRWLIYRTQLKLPLIKSVILLANYAMAGLRKYRKR